MSLQYPGKPLNSIVAILTILLIPSVCWGQTRLLGVRYWSAPDETRVVLDLDRPIEYKLFKLTDPERLVLDIPNMIAKGIPREIGAKDQIVDRIRIRRKKSGTLRLVIDLKKPVQFEVFSLGKYAGKPRRLVLDLRSPELNEKVREERQAFKKLNRKVSRLIVVDPGHGGEDPGAIGFRGTKEKDVVLAIGKSLKTFLDKEVGIRAVLTRRADYFIPLRKRVEIAEEYGADLFISLHADANHSRKARGASVYCLSIKGATDEAARILADKENQSDLIGGVKIPYEDRGLSAILLDLRQTNTINESLEFGGLFLRELRPISRIKFHMPKQAGFFVLRSYKFPAVLIETGFITNPKDEKNLRSPWYQKKLASAISSASFQFLRPVPSSRGRIVASQNSPSSNRSHVVQKGQTLSQIARMYNTTTIKLMRLNRLENASKIFAGQKLRIP